MTVGFFGHGQPTRFRFGANLSLGRGVSQREHGVLELLMGQHAQHIALVLGPVCGTVQFRVSGCVGDDLGVVACADGVETQGDGLFQQRRELDPFVAAHARVGSAPGGVFINEILDHILLETFGEVPDIVRNAQLVTGPPRVVGVFHGATTTAARAQGPGHAGERQVHPDHVMSGIHCPGCCYGGVNSAAHGGQYSHCVPFL